MGESAGTSGEFAERVRGLVQPVSAEEPQGDDAREGNGEAEHDGGVDAQGPLPNLRTAPDQPGQDDIDRHLASGHVP